MSEKRFTFYYERGNEVVIEDNGKRLSNKKVVDLLNEQQDTNDYLEEANSRLQVQLGKTLRLVDEQQDTIRKLRNENIISKNKIEDLRVSLFMQDQVLQRQMQKSDLDE